MSIALQGDDLRLRLLHLDVNEIVRWLLLRHCDFYLILVGLFLGLLRGWFSRGTPHLINNIELVKMNTIN